ncbi:hypothetical protein [Candidatus Chloroploca sp. Khr17]|uniref:hypothetical protein n=1 Tax=Candidatus Chloroploca sp. Khr17 TaxID=2496869 RepID=UPI00101DF1A4|nr:hypothetical protein [Candidatus Chloroploca sp. Khr17]
MHASQLQPYLPCADLWVITTHYNPVGYAARRENYQRFAQPLNEAGINLVTVECAFGDEPFELAPSPSVIQVRGRDVMWMKERLLNLAIERLPPHVTKVAWIDADVLFTNPAWAQETSALLDTWPIVQPFETIYMLQHGEVTPLNKGHPSFARQQCNRSRLHSGRHGAPGGAWASRRALVQLHGIYDTAIIGGGDDLWIHASVGRLRSARVCGVTGAPRRRLWLVPAGVSGRLERMRWPAWLIDWRVSRIRSQLPALAVTEPFLAHYLAWATGWYAAVRGRMAFTTGDALHLWHGAPAKRRYGPRNGIIRRHALNPRTDLRLNAQGVWEWASDKEALHRELAEYFQSRREDDDAE